MGETCNNYLNHERMTTWKIKSFKWIILKQVLRKICRDHRRALVNARIIVSVNKALEISWLSELLLHSEGLHSIEFFRMGPHLRLTVQ